MEITVSGIIPEQQYIAMMMRYRLLKTDSLSLLLLGCLCIVFVVCTLFIHPLVDIDLIVLLAGIYLLAYWPLRLYFFYRKSYVTSKALQGVMHYTFRVDDIGNQSINGTGSLSWDVLDRVLNTRHAFFLYQNHNVFSPVMKHWFTPAQLAEFTAFLKAKQGLKLEGF